MKKERPEPTNVIGNPEALGIAQKKASQFFADIYFAHEKEIDEKIKKRLLET